MFRPLFRAALAAIVLSSSSLAFAQDGHAGGAITIGTLAVHDGFARATLPNAPVGGVFFAVTNTGATPDRLVAVTAPELGDGQIHEMSMQGDVMKMRPLPDGIVIPAGETVTLEPSGLHVMIMGLKTPLVEGQSVRVTLTFEAAGSVALEFPVLGVAAGHAHH